jgi:hypothetical protein
LNQLSADTLVLVRRAHVQAGDLALVLVRIYVQGDTCDRIPVDLEDEVVADALFDHGACSLHQLLGLDRLAGEQLNSLHVLLRRRPDVFVDVRVDQGAEPVIVEDLGEKPLLEPAIDDVHARHTRRAGSHSVTGSRQHLRAEASVVVLHETCKVAHGHLTYRLSVIDQPRVRRDENQLDGLQVRRDRHGHAVRVQPVRVAVAVESERRHDGNDTLVEQGLQERCVDPFDAAGEQLIDPLDDSRGVRNNDVRAGGAEVVHRQALEDLVRQPVGRSQRELKSHPVGDTGAFHVRRMHLLSFSQHPDLLGGTMNDHDPDIERPQQRDVEEERREVLVSDDAAVQREDEGPVAELRHVVQDAAQIGELHVNATIGAGAGNRRKERVTKVHPVCCSEPRADCVAEPGAIIPSVLELTQEHGGRAAALAAEADPGLLQE